MTSNSKSSKTASFDNRASTTKQGFTLEGSLSQTFEEIAGSTMQRKKSEINTKLLEMQKKVKLARIRNK
jgi:hypothetical protein